MHAHSSLAPSKITCKKKPVNRIGSSTSHQLGVMQVNYLAQKIVENRAVHGEAAKALSDDICEVLFFGRQRNLQNKNAFQSAAVAVWGRGSA